MFWTFKGSSVPKLVSSPLEKHYCKVLRIHPRYKLCIKVHISLFQAVRLRQEPWKISIAQKLICSGKGPLDYIVVYHTQKNGFFFTERFFVHFWFLLKLEKSV